MKTSKGEKETAIKLRKEGKSIRDIEKILKVSRSTLSGWLHNIELSEKQKKQLHENWQTALIKARAIAAELNRAARLERIRKIRQNVEKLTSGIVIDRITGELIFATFYLAEGTKTEGSVIIANSNPEILKSLLNLFGYLYKPDISKFRCCLHLRKDQSEKELKNYWSKILDIPKSQFVTTQFDKRTIKPTFKNYKGVCVVLYHDTNLQRRILYTGEKVLQMIETIKGTWRSG